MAYKLVNGVAGKWMGGRGGGIVGDCTKVLFIITTKKAGCARKASFLERQREANRTYILDCSIRVYIYVSRKYGSFQRPLRDLLAS